MDVLLKQPHPRHADVFAGVDVDKHALEVMLQETAFHLHHVMQDPTTTFRLFPPATDAAHHPSSRPQGRRSGHGPSVTSHKVPFPLLQSHDASSMLSAMFGHLPSDDMPTEDGGTPNHVSSASDHADPRWNAQGRVVTLWSGPSGHTGLSVRHAQLKAAAAQACKTPGFLREPRSRASVTPSASGGEAESQEPTSALRDRDWCVAVELPAGVARSSLAVRAHAMAVSPHRATHDSDTLLRSDSGRNNMSAEADVLTLDMALAAFEVTAVLPPPLGVPEGCTTLPPVLPTESDASAAPGAEHHAVDGLPTAQRGDLRLTSRPHIMQLGFVLCPGPVLFVFCCCSD